MDVYLVDADGVSVVLMQDVCVERGRIFSGPWEKVFEFVSFFFFFFMKAQLFVPFR